MNDANLNPNGDDRGSGLSWFGVRSHYQGKRAHGVKTYEERIVLFQATGPDDALAQAKDEALMYAGLTLVVLPLFRVSKVLRPGLAAGHTVYSELRDSELGPAEYLKAFFDNGTETTVWS